MSGTNSSITFTQPETGPEAPVTATVPSTERPSYLPEKFKTPEDLATAYKELEAKYTKGQQGNEPPSVEDTPTAELPEPPSENTQTDTERPSPDSLDEYAIINEYRSGELSPDTLASIKKVYGENLPDDVIVNYIKMYSGQVEQQQEALYKEAGGRDALERMKTYAQQNYSKEELAALTDAGDSGDYERIRQAIVALKGRYEKAYGRTPQYIRGAPAAPGGEAYESAAQWMRDMSDPLYKSDPAFRAKVEKKLSRSSF